MFGIISSQKGFIAGLDADAFKFVNQCRTQGSQLTIAEQTYIKFIVDSLKGNNTSYNPLALNIWNDVPAIWPYVGRSQNTHVLNLKDPRDDDSAFRLSFEGSFTHDANGVTPNTTAVRALTHLFPALLPDYFNDNSFCGFFYNRTDVIPDFQPTQVDIGSTDLADSGIPRNGFVLKRSDSFGFASLNRFPDWVVFGNLGSAGGYKGTWLYQKRASNYREIVQNNDLFITDTSAPTSALTTGQMTFFSRGDAQGSTRPASLHGFSSGLSNDKRTALINIINQAQVILGRNV